MVDSNQEFKNKYLNKKEIFMKFLFLQHPIKIRKHTVFILILASMMAFSVVLSYISIPIPASGIKISFTWLPTIVIGWFFGPIIGFIMGFAIDTLNFLIHGGIWFWLYAIQEPLVGFLVGIISFLKYLISHKSKNETKTSFIITEVILSMFFIFMILFFVFVYIFHFDLLNLKQGTNIVTTTLITVVFILISVFYLIMQTITIIKYFKKENHNFFYIILICCLITMIFSFLLGPISAVEYLKYINNRTPSSFIKYGYLAWLIPRVIKETFKTPVYIFLLWSLTSCLEPVVKRIVNQVKHTWKV